jgi:3-hydroxybutyryl-CoA dehydrogenase
MIKQKRPKEPVGVIGLGLMGRGIVTCLLANGFHVVGHDRSTLQAAKCSARIRKALAELVRRNFLTRAGARHALRRLRVVRPLDEMRECVLVIEALTENLEIKRALFKRLEPKIKPDSVIASNTSSFPIKLLQKGAAHPDRFIGMHWAEPAEITRYLEIIPGEDTSASTISRTRQVGEQCGKKPTILKVDIRGFLSNRMMYAMLREACYLVESGVADLETVDQSFRNDIGWWATFAGPFRWMDLTGIPAYATVMEGLLPELSNEKKVPRIMRDAVQRGARGISNTKGFYQYSKFTAHQWERAWVDITYDIRRMVEKYEGRMKL